MSADDLAKFHKNRSTGIGGSDAAVAIGLSPWRTALELYLEKRGELPPGTQEESEPMRWGKLLEPIVRQRYADLTGRAVRIPEFMRHPKHEFVVAHPDGITDDKRLLEVKTSRSPEGWGEPGSDAIPQAYLIQVQHYLMVTALPVADVAVLIGGSDFRTYEVPEDTELQEMILDGEAAFWQRVQQGVPPEPDYSAPTTMSLIRRMYHGTNGQSIVANQAQESWRLVLEDSMSMTSKYAVMAEAAKAHLLMGLGEGAALVFADGKALRRKEVVRKGYTVAESRYIDSRLVKHNEKDTL